MQDIIDSLNTGNNYYQYFILIFSFIRNDLKKYSEEGRRIMAIETHTPTAKTTSVDEFKEHCK